MVTWVTNDIYCFCRALILIYSTSYSSNIASKTFFYSIKACCRWTFYDENFAFIPKNESISTFGYFTQLIIESQSVIHQGIGWLIRHMIDLIFNLLFLLLIVTIDKIIHQLIETVNILVNQTIRSVVFQVGVEYFY